MVLSFEIMPAVYDSIYLLKAASTVEVCWPRIIKIIDAKKQVSKIPIMSILFFDWNKLFRKSMVRLILLIKIIIYLSIKQELTKVFLLDRK